jgi:hypothetical protein
MPTSMRPQMEAILDKIAQLIERNMSAQEVDELRSIVRRPGWRTVAEQSLFIALATALLEHLEAGVRLRSELLEASKQISPIPKRAPR